MYFIVDLDFIKVRIFEAMPLRGIVNHGVHFGPIEYHNAVRINAAVLVLDGYRLQMGLIR